MPQARRIFKLDQPDGPHRRFMCGLDGVKLSHDSAQTEVTITRTGVFTDPRYGRFEITRDMLLSMVRNFEAGIYGQDIFIDVAHKPNDGAAAKVLGLKVDGGRLRAQLEFTPFGVDAVKNRGFRYFSAEFADDFVDNETQKSHGPTLLGAALTTRPVIKRLDPVTLSEAPADTPVFLHPHLIRQLSEHLESITMNWLEQLKKRLTALKLSETTIKSICDAYVAAAKNLGEDEDAHKALITQLEATGKTLAESGQGDKPIMLSVNVPGAGKTLSAEDVQAILKKDRDDAAAAQKKLAETQAARVKVFTDAIAAAEGLSEETRKHLGESADLITADMSEEQVTKLATQQIALGNKIEASKKLADLGFSRSGSPHISVDDGNAIKQLSVDIRKHLGSTNAAQAGRLRLVEDEKLSPFTQRVLSEFDQRHASQLHREAKMLSGGPVDIGDTALPASVQREVLREAYQDLRILDLVVATVDPTNGPTHSVPYEERDISGVQNDGVVYEGQGIRAAGISQKMGYAYIEPRKLAMKLSNEVAFFTRNNAQINWDAWGRNIASNAKYMRELTARAITNRMQRNADSYAAADVAAGGATTAYTGATNGYKVANYPVIRPYQARDLQGSAVGSEKNPIVVKDGATALSEFDGTGQQSAGKYYKVLSYNLGLFQIVDETGAATAPAGTVTIGYSYATNVMKVDTDIASGSTLEKQMNKLIQAVGARKAVLNQDRYVSPDFLLMSSVLNDMATNAEQYTASGKRPDSAITVSGDLADIKAVPAWSTNGPSDMGDERILIGQRGAFFYTIAKAFQTGAPYEVMDSNGRPTGERGAYGEEYSSLYVPESYIGRFTSVLAYSATTARGS